MGIFSGSGGKGCKWVFFKNFCDKGTGLVTYKSKAGGRVHPLEALGWGAGNALIYGTQNRREAPKRSKRQAKKRTSRNVTGGHGRLKKPSPDSKREQH